MRLRISAFAATATLFVAGSAAAQAVVPSFSAVCDDKNVVDKDKLVLFLIDAKPVSRSLEDWATANPNPAFPVGPRARMLLDSKICNQAKTACRSTDAANLGEGLQGLSHMLSTYGEAFLNDSQARTPFAYLTSGARLLCQRQNAGPADAVPTPTFIYTFPIRVRGSTDGLNFDRTEPSFSIVQGASVAVSKDDINHKKVEKWSIVAGVALPPLVDRTDTSLYLVPYVGSTRDFTRVTGKADVTNAKSTFGGLLLDYRLRRPTAGSAMTHYMTLAPEYRRSRSDADASKLWTVTATWMPIVNGLANDFVPIKSGERVASWRLIFDIRGVHGHFTDVGNLPAPYNEDFTRVGSQFGFAIKSDNPRWPLDLVVTDTQLPNLGSGKDLSYFASRLSLALDPKKIFTVDLTYSNGRRADVIVDEDQWKVSLGAKY